MTGTHTVATGTTPTPNLVDICEFTGNNWKIAVATFSTSAVNPSDSSLPRFPGTNLPYSGRVEMTRSGTFSGEYSIVEVGGARRLASVLVDNNTRGSETYPPTDGPAQGKRTETASLAITTAVANTLNLLWN